MPCNGPLFARGRSNEIRWESPGLSARTICSTLLRLSPRAPWNRTNAERRLLILRKMCFRCWLWTEVRDLHTAAVSECTLHTDCKAVRIHLFKKVASGKRWGTILMGLQYSDTLTSTVGKYRIINYLLTILYYRPPHMPYFILLINFILIYVE